MNNAPSVSPPLRDELFISYAGEDDAFVRWLAGKLSASGYRVWWDRRQLSGGDAFTSDIDEAIKVRAFRMLAVVSKHSVSKPNPDRERTLGLAIAKERDESFVIPLNMGLAATKLPWMLSTANYISFAGSWATGLGALLETLREHGAPWFPTESHALVQSYLQRPTYLVCESEPVWANLFAISAPPTSLSLYEWEADVPDGGLYGWIYQRRDARSCWAFEAPPTVPGLRAPARDQVSTSFAPPAIRRVMTSLLRQYVEARCRARGLHEADGRVFYFPSTLEISERLPFTLPDGRETWLKPVGYRSIRQRGQFEQIRYHLGLQPRVELSRFGAPVLQIKPTVHFTDKDGASLDSAGNVRRAKATRRGWYNDKWLARIAALGAYLADGETEWQLVPGHECKVVASPVAFSAPLRLDEALRAEGLRQPVEEHIDEDEAISLLELDDEEGVSDE
jgi:hypothetical protein